MSVLSCKLMPQATLDINAKFNRTYVHSFLVEADEIDHLPGQILSEAASASPDPIPDLWTHYDFSSWHPDEVDEGSYLQAVKVARHHIENSPDRFWKITCTWSPPEPGQGGEPPVEDPLERPVRYHLEEYQYTRRVNYDVIDDRKIANSADDFYEDVTVEDGRPVLVAVKNMWPLEDIIELAIAYKNAVNSDVFFGAPAGTAKVESIQSGQIMSENGVDFYAVTFRIQFTTEEEGPDGWHLRLPNRGSMCYILDPDFGPVKTRVRVTDGPDGFKGQFRDQAYLNYDGTQRDDEEDPLPMPPEDEDPFHIYRELPFSGLDIGGD